jgi:uncharacterized protein (DUF305 family)
MRRTGIAVLVTALAAGLAAVAAAQEQGAAVLAADAGGEAPPLYNEQDLLFLRHMIVHHQQALDMAVLVPERTERPEFIRFARYVAGAQAAEIEIMQSLLELAADRGLAVPEHGAHHGTHGHPSTTGMLSAEQMDALAAASGAQFERLWLEGMIFHHEGALEMARAQQRQQLESRRRPYGIDVLVEDILIEQRAEITRMRAWLAEWELSSEP